MIETAQELLNRAAYTYMCTGSLGLTLTQREMRRSVIGGSDAGSIVAGGKEWRLLWEQKTRRSDEPDFSGVLAVLMGQWTEPFNRCWYQIQTSRKVERISDYCRHPTIPYLAVNLDGMSTTSEGHPCSWQAKHVGASGDRTTLRYTAQCTHEALCMGVDWWVMSSFIGNSRWELTEQEVDPLFASEYLELCKEFWRYVERDQEPPEDIPPLGVPAPAKPLITVNLNDAGERALHNWSSAMIAELEAHTRTLGPYKAHLAIKDSIKALLPDHVGTVLHGRAKVAKDRVGAVRISYLKNGGSDE